LLFLVTLFTTTYVGAYHYLSYASDFGRRNAHATLTDGLWYSLTIVAILGAHEMGHYIMCRRYNVDASLPYFIPLLFPPAVPIQTGTLGAVIRIREAFPNRKVLFDIGVGGPIAGFLVLVPALFIGLAMSNVAIVPKNIPLVSLGEPLLFKAAVKLMFGTIPTGSSVNMHPMVFAAWFGMLATALNLLPFGQLDGGHLTYATLRKWATPISLATVATAIMMTSVARSWMVFTLMMVVMLLMFGPRHPLVIYEDEPLPKNRYWVAVFALVMLILCLSPVPMELIFPTGQSPASQTPAAPPR
jgi:membrane-associated protease RseP (regulator of RpoE activity)